MCFVLNALCTQRSCKLRPIKKNCLHIHSHSMCFGFFYLSHCQLITIMNLILIKNDAGDQKATTAPCICGKRFINSSILNAQIALAMGIQSFLRLLPSIFGFHCKVTEGNDFVISIWHLTIFHYDLSTDKCLKRDITQLCGCFHRSYLSFITMWFIINSIQKGMKFLVHLLKEPACVVSTFSDHWP